MNLSQDTPFRRMLYWIKEHPSPFRIIGSLFFLLTAIFAVIWILGKEVEPIAFAFSLCSTFFFAVPTIVDVLAAEKSLSKMTYEELLAFVESSDASADWQAISDDKSDEFFCLKDTGLRVRNPTGEERYQSDDFKAGWANSFPDPHAYGLWFDLCYRGDRIKRFLLVGVDGLRASIPCPDPDTMTINPLQDSIGRIVAFRITDYEEYKRRSNISVRKT